MILKDQVNSCESGLERKTPPFSHFLPIMADSLPTSPPCDTVRCQHHGLRLSSHTKIISQRSLFIYNRYCVITTVNQVSIRRKYNEVQAFLWHPQKYTALLKGLPRFQGKEYRLHQMVKGTLSHCRKNILNRAYCGGHL